MGRSFWLLRMGALLAYFAGGLAVWTDAKFSQQWIIATIHPDKIMPGLSIGMSFVLAVCVSSFGAIITAPYSWQIIYAQIQKVGAIGNKNERQLSLIGFILLSGFLMFSFIFTYTFNVLSTFKTTNNIWFSFAIVLAGDVCFLLANILWWMSSFAKSAENDIFGISVKPHGNYKG